MNSNNLISYLEDPKKNGVSVWVFQGKKNLIFVAENLLSIPKLNSNYTYCIAHIRHNTKVLNDESYCSLKFFFWVGIHSLDHDANYEQTILLLQKFKKEQLP